MHNLAAFAPAPKAGEATKPRQDSSGGVIDLELVAGGQPAPALDFIDHPRDADGLLIPTFWQANEAKWGQLALSVRQKQSKVHEEWISREAAKLANQKPASDRPHATRYTTDYAVAEGRRRGWKLIDRERWDDRTKRHHDLELGTDAAFDDGHGRILIQAAGRSERAAHYQRFIDRGGVEKARRRSTRVLYWEFVRGNPKPLKEEQWA